MRTAGWLLLGLLWMIGSTPVLAQTTLTGQVTDAETGEPLVGANVFLDGTMRGAATDADGQFRIEGVPPGSYRLIASMVGYQAGRQAVTVAPGGGTRSFQFALQPAPVELGGVTVEGSRDEWLDRLDQFKRHFLGAMRHADACAILNPEVLSFTVNERTGAFRAVAEAPLQIENRALGYEITYVLRRFNVRGERIDEESFGRFRAMVPEDEQQREEWTEARERAYRGSFQHFVRALADDRFEQEGFRVYTAPARTFYYGPNPQLRLDGVRQVERVGPITESAMQPTQLVLRFASRFLRVEYVREQEAYAYRQSRLNRPTRRASNKQLSWVALPRGRALVDVRSGQAVRPFAPVLFGYWSWQERAANALPRAYEPGR
jgi:hypothetical protein